MKHFDVKQALLPAMSSAGGPKLKTESLTKCRTSVSAEIPFIGTFLVILLNWSAINRRYLFRRGVLMNFSIISIHKDDNGDVFSNLLIHLANGRPSRF